MTEKNQPSLLKHCAHCGEEFNAALLSGGDHCFTCAVHATCVCSDDVGG